MSTFKVFQESLSPLIIKRAKIVYIYLVLYIVRAREDDLERSQPCKNRVVCLSVLGHNSRKSREPLERFSQNFVLRTF